MAQQIVGPRRRKSLAWTGWPSHWASTSRDRSESLDEPARGGMRERRPIGRGLKIRMSQLPPSSRIRDGRGMRCGTPTGRVPHGGSHPVHHLPQGEGRAHPVRGQPQARAQPGIGRQSGQTGRKSGHVPDRGKKTIHAVADDFRRAAGSNTLLCACSSFSYVLLPAARQKSSATEWMGFSPPSGTCPPLRRACPLWRPTPGCARASARLPGPGAHGVYPAANGGRGAGHHAGCGRLARCTACRARHGFRGMEATAPSVFSAGGRLDRASVCARQPTHQGLAPVPGSASPMRRPAGLCQALSSGRVRRCLALWLGFPAALQNIRCATRLALRGMPVAPHLAAGWRRTGWPPRVPAADRRHSRGHAGRRLGRPASGPGGAATICHRGRLVAGPAARGRHCAARYPGAPCAGACGGGGLARVPLLSAQPRQLPDPRPGDRPGGRPEFPPVPPVVQKDITRAEQLRFTAAYRRSRGLDRHRLRHILTLLEACLRRA